MNDGYLGIMVDCSRNAVLNISGVKKLIDCLEKMGYNMLMLYTEDTYEVDNQPKFGYLRGRYSKDEMKTIVAYGEAHGIELIPCIQTLAHLNQIFRYPEYKEINDCDDILLIDDDRTYAFIEDMFKTLRECYNTKHIHIGMDEAHNVGKGKYRDIHGETDRIKLIMRHLERIGKIAEKYGFKPMMWSDMFFRLATGGEYYITDPSVITPEIAACAPENIDLVYWDYYQTEQMKYDRMIEAHRNFKNDMWFAGGAITWEGMSPYNAIAISRSIPAMKSCRENGVNKVTVTCWGDNGGEASIFSVLPALFATAEAYRGNFDQASVKQKFYDTFGIAFDDFMKLDLPNLITESYSLWASSNNRVLMYNDPFLGAYDAAIEMQAPNLSEHFEKTEKILSKLSDAPDFGYLFKVSATFCKFLSYKAELGVKIRNAYKAGNKAELRTLCERIKLAEDALDEFYFVYRNAWLTEKKGSGFEVQDIRIGGLRMRLIDCRLRLCDYLDGRIDKIDDLAEDIIEPNKLLSGWWKGIVSANVI